MRRFSKEELVAVVVIFLILGGISTPNFISSLMRGRDQNRKDDMGNITKFLSTYQGDFNSYPLSTEDGKIVACKRPEDTVEVDKKGNLIVDLIPCVWGKDKIVDLTPGSTKVYIEVLPGDPLLDKGVTYKYFSDGARFQIFAALENEKDPEYDEKVIKRNISCGERICNLGRSYGCDIEKTLEQCQLEAMQKTQ